MLLSENDQKQHDSPERQAMISAQQLCHRPLYVRKLFRFGAGCKKDEKLLCDRRKLTRVTSPGPGSVLLAVLILSLQTMLSPSVFASESPLVAAASGTRFALREIVDSFKAETGIDVRLTLASSGKLFRQIENSAPFEIFISADANLTHRLAATGLTLGDPFVIARGRLAIIAPVGSPLEPDSTLQGLHKSLSRGQISRFSVASPEHAPYGRRTREALQEAGLWASLQDKLVVGENVAQATQFALSSTAQGGIVALSLLAPEKTLDPDRYRYALLPEAWHQPLLHSMVLLKNADQTTMQFFQYLKSQQARQILSRYGYSSGL